MNFSAYIERCWALWMRPNLFALIIAPHFSIYSSFLLLDLFFLFLANFISLNAIALQKTQLKCVTKYFKLLTLLKHLMQVHIFPLILFRKLE